MYVLYLEKHFVASVRKLEKNMKKELNENLQLLQNNPTHPYLHLKPLHGSLSGFYSIRVKEYRVIIEFLKDKKIRLLDIGRRDRIYK